MSEEILKKLVYIIDGARTPISNPYRSLKEFTATQLGAFVIKELVRRTHLNKKCISEIILGNTVSAGIGQNFTRQAAMMAGLPDNIPSFTVNNVCGSGMQAVLLAVKSILSGDAEICIAGGAESATHNPFLLKRDDENSQNNKDQVDSLQYDGLYCPISGKSMGQLAQDLANRYFISQQDQDEFSLNSHRKAVFAQEQEKFQKEIIALKTSQRKRIDRDDRPRRNITLDSLQSLPPAFQRGGSVTAGNSSVACDGAAAILLASEESLEKYKLIPKAKIISYASVMINPQKSFEAASLSIKTCLKKRNMNIDDVDLFEIGEAFAVQMVMTKKKLKIPDNKINVNGGDIAFGHPLGVAGARVIVTLIHALQDKRKKIGVASISYGGGGALSVLVESL